MSLTTTLALHGGAPAVSRPVPAWPIAGDLEAAWMEAVVRSGAWSWNGPHEQAFCREFASFIGTKHCMLLSNGTVTLQCALQAVGVEPGDEVIVPGMTWVATAQAAFDIGADVVFADVDPETLCLDPKAYERAITPRTKAVIPVHLYGAMCDMDAIMEISRRRGIKVVEDVAHQHGSRWRNVGAGAIGDVGSFSMQQSKVLTCGEGGAVTTNDPQVHEIVHCLKHVGHTPGFVAGNRYGHNYRGTEMQAVLLRGGLSRLTEQTLRREASAARISAGLERIGGPVRAVARDPRVTRQAHYCMTLYYDPQRAGGLTKAEYAAALAAEGLHLQSTYPPVYRAPLMNLYDRTSPVPFRDQSRLQDYRSLKLPNVERAVAETALLMFHTYLLGDDAYIDSLLSAIEKVNAAIPALLAARPAQAQAKKSA
ncbi:MAG: DegT/DnrJ/EryC1/StrS family aminotransferase [Planctomycetes bacterium]|nr:DegT/DnrJ/EryC1/StrS family aminotransferase [Planctomycetota bacterium]